MLYYKLPTTRDKIEYRYNKRCQSFVNDLNEDIAISSTFTMQQNLPPYDYRYNRPPDPQYQTVRRSSSNITLAEMQNIFLQNPNLLLRLEQDYVENVLYDLLFEVAIDVSCFYCTIISISYLFSPLQLIVASPRTGIVVDKIWEYNNRGPLSSATVICILLFTH